MEVIEEGRTDEGEIRYQSLLFQYIFKGLIYYYIVMATTAPGYKILVFSCEEP